MADFFDALIEEETDDLNYYVSSQRQGLDLIVSLFNAVASKAKVSLALAEATNFPASLQSSLSKEVIVLLVDGSQGMRREAELEGVEGFSATDSFLDVTVKVLVEFLKQTIIGYPRNRVAVIFYGAEKAKNSSSFPNVHVFHEPDQSTAARIKDVEALLDDFNSRVGSADSGPAESLRDGLWAASQIFAGETTKAERRLLVFTTHQNPGREDAFVRNQIESRAKQLQEAKVNLQLFNLSRPSDTFSLEPFWKDIVSPPEDASALRKGVLEPLLLTDLIVNMRQKMYRKRPMTSLKLKIGPNFQIAVKLYALVRKAAISKAVSIDLKTNAHVKAEGAFICNDTGAILKEITKYSFPKKGSTARFPQIIFTAEERKALSAHGPPGIEILGFKRLKCLKMHHQLGPSTFVYPDEKTLQGSTTAFVALHDRCLKRGVFALCEVVRSKISQPRLAAMLAQEEEVDENGSQITPPGFNLIHLPFADDIRSPETDRALMGDPPYPRATEEQVEAAAAVVEKLRLEGFEAGSVPNPHIQWHYKVVEALALGEEPPTFSAEDDLTMPDIEGQQRRAKDELLAFNAAIYGQDGGPKPSPEKKRKLSVAEGEGPDFKVENSTGRLIGWNFKLAEDGELHSLTLGPLKDFCKNHRLSTNGRKDDIVDRITKFFEERAKNE